MKELEIVQKLENILRKSLKRVNAYFEIGYELNENQQLVKLNLSDCQIKNLLALNLIGELTELKVLYLNNNNIKDIGLLSKWKSIEILDLRNNSISDISSLNKLQHLNNLDLSNNDITDISPLKNMKQLKKLLLIKNKIVDISPINNLKQLKFLYLSYNQIREITPIKDLKQLELLNLYANNIVDISPLIDLKHLTKLSVGRNNFKNTNPLHGLENLISLDLEGCGLVDISFLSNFKKLVKLNIGRNNIEDISSLSELIKLNYLILEHNKITDISPLKNNLGIYTLDLTSNQIIKLPKWITNYLGEIRSGRDIFPDGSLKSGAIYVDEVTVKSPPNSIIKEGKKAIVNYFKQIENEEGKTKYLFEVKLLVIGEGGTGKTTFTRKIQDINADVPSDKDTTLGIEVNNWNYTIDFSKIPGFGEVNFYVNLWDFGGQKIYQGTHQIFFSNKAFYVLIADTREQKTDFSYWLNTVEQLGGEDSSLVIILNKKYGHEHKLDETGYRNHFGKLIKEIISLDLITDKSGLLVLQEKIKMYLKHLPGIGDSLPPSWVSIREELIKLKVNYISFDQFREICKIYNIEDPSMIDTISGYYSRIGAFTHYTNDPLLQERIYLNSNWLVKTVYEVLDNQIAKEKKGRISEFEIVQIWGENNLQYEINKLTQLMHKFGLMYHIPDSDKYVIPAHLPTITPYNKWPNEESGNILHFIYEFDKYMPQGIMSRLIVALHHHINDHDKVWHRGVNIESNGSNAEIIETYGSNNSFEIRIVGRNKIELLAIIRERFSEVLNPFNKLKYKQLIPCICEECKDSSSPAFHDYNLLLVFKDKGVGSQCSKTGEIVSPEELLKIIEPKFRFKVVGDELKSEIDQELNRKTLSNLKSLFLSYSSNDKSLALKLASILTINGVQVWMDEWQIKVGDSISHKIQEGIKNSQYLAVLLTPNSVNSGWVEREWQSAFHKEISEGMIKVLPVLGEKCEIPVLLHDKRYADLTKSFNEGAEAILARFENL